MLTVKLAQVSQTSLIFYLGLEGLGGLDMDTDEAENVCHDPSHVSSPLNYEHRA